MAIHLFPGEHGEIWVTLEVGWEKVACWSTKTTISLKRVKTIIPDAPYTASYSSRLECATPTKTLITIISGTGRHKATDFKFDRQAYVDSQGPSKQKLI